MNPFEQYIQELNRILGISLYAEKGYLCKLIIEGSLKLQLEHEPAEERILIASFLCELPPGKFREDVLKEALKANDSLNREGIFAYSGTNNSLVYFLYFSDTLPSDQLAKTLLQFIEIAKKWKTAVETGQLYLITEQSNYRASSSFTL